MIEADENSRSFLYRFYIYQKERFPFFLHGVLISVFTFSAISYSIFCRKAEAFVTWPDFFIGVFIVVSLFFLVRIFDEFKDNDSDIKYRSYLPVPRGLISLKELQVIAIITVSLQLLVLFFFQKDMLLLYGVVLLYLLLMRVEFFIPEWLKERQILYITSHMFVIPLIDIYSSGLDWRLSGNEPHNGLIWFFCVSYFNGLVLEFGRKMRSPEHEELGVVSYTGMFGVKKGVVLWMGLLLTTMVLAVFSSNYAELGTEVPIVLMISSLVCILPGILFMLKPTKTRSKWIEIASAGWTFLMYLSLGGVSMLKLIYL